MRERRVEGDLVEGEGREVDLALVDLAEADVAHLGREAGLLDAGLDELAQVGLLVPDEDVAGGDVAHHARDARVGRRGHGVAHEHVEQLLLRVGAPGALLVEVDEARAPDERAGVELDLVGEEARVLDEGAEVLLVGLGRRGREVGHEVRVDLEAEEARQGEGADDLADVGPAAAGVEHLLAGGLDAHLHLGAAEAAKQGEALGRDAVGAGLDDEADHAVGGGLVSPVLGLELVAGGVHDGGGPGPGRVRVCRAVDAADGVVVAHGAARDQALLFSAAEGELVGVGGEAAAAVVGAALALALARVAPVVEGAEELADEPELVGLVVVAPGAAEDDELDLVGRVAHLVERAQAAGHLQVGVEVGALGALARGLVGEVALGHSHVAGAEDAVARAGVRAGDDRDGGHARRRAARLHAKRREEAPLEDVVDLP